MLRSDWNAIYNMKEFNREKVVIGINSVEDFNFFLFVFKRRDGTTFKLNTIQGNS